MKKIFFFISFLLLSCNLIAQIVIDQQISALEDSVKIKIEQFGEKHEEVVYSYFDLFDILLEQAKYNEAFSIAEKCLTICLEVFGEKHSLTAAANDALGEVYYCIRDYSNALEFLKKALKIHIDEFGEMDTMVAHSYYNIGVVYSITKDYTKALEYYHKALFIWKEIFGENHTSTTNSISRIGFAYQEIGDYSNALKYYQKALNIQLEISGEKHSLTAESYQNLGSVYSRSGDYFKALGYYQKALAIQHEASKVDQSSIVESYQCISIIYMLIGNYSKALEYHQKLLSIELLELGEKHPSIAEYYSTLGFIHRETGNYSEALKFIQKSLEISLEVLGEKHYSTSDTYNNLGVLYQKMGEYPKALEIFQKAIKISIEISGEKHNSIAGFYHNIGFVYNKMGDYPKALEYFQKSLAIRSEVSGDNGISNGDCYNNIGSVYYNLGDYSKALEFHQIALEMYIKVLGKMHPKVGNVYNNLGSIYYKTGKYSKALEFYQKTLEICLESLGEMHHSTAAANNNLGVVYSNMQNYSKSLKYYQKTLEICRKTLGEMHHSTGAAYNNLGSLYFKTKEYSNALKSDQKALIIYLEVFDQKHPKVNSLQVDLAIVFKELEQFSKADSLWDIIIPDLEYQLRRNYLFLPDNKKLFYLNTVDEKFDKFYNFTSNYGSEQTKVLAANLLINTKSQILDYAISTRQLIENINDENLDSIFIQLNNINQKVAKAELLSQDELNEKGWSLDTLRLQQDDLASQILEHPELKAKLNPAKFSWQQIQEKLQASEALIDYFVYYDWEDSAWVYQAMLIKKDEPKPIFIAISTTKPVIDLLKTKNRLPLYTQYKEARQEMYEYLWKALEPHLKNIETIHLTPVASLNKIDFGSLQNEEGQYLADLYDFHYYSSSKDFFKQNHRKPTYIDATLYGHIAYYAAQQKQYKAEEDSFALRLHRDTLRALPATLPEVKAIEEICSMHKVSSILLTINEAKEDSIEYFSANRAPSIMHFATHGAYLPPLHKKEETIATASLSGQDRFRAADNPLQRSMLMLSNAGDTWKGSGPNIVTENDGILTALEVTNLDLSNTKLVVLSACNSGIGSQHTTEGVFGLPRAFKLAGVDKILVSLWPVEDETTKELMILFYTNLLQYKQDAAAALRNAKAEMRKRDDRPKKWAGFVLVE